MRIEGATYTRALGDSELYAPNLNGDADEEADSVREWAESHEATITVPYDFHMSRHHVTVGEFMEFVRDTGYVTTVIRDRMGYIVSHDAVWTQGAINDWRQTFWRLRPDIPVTQVSWYDAMAYARWKSEEIGREVRLPTLEEWELAARDPQRLGAGAWPWGEDFDPKRANCADSRFSPYEWRHRFTDGFRYVNPVDAFPPNARGIRDAVGNVWSWVYTTEAARDASTGTYEATRPAFEEPAPTQRVAVVGGGFPSRVSHCHLMAPIAHPAHDGAMDIGFRLVTL